MDYLSQAATIERPIVFATSLSLITVGGQGGAPSRRSELPAMPSRKGSEKCMVTTTTDLIEDWIQMRSTLQRQLKMLESGKMHTGDNIPDSTTRDTTVRVRRCIDELNSLLKEFAIAPPRP
jgi:hypothetical protein